MYENFDRNKYRGFKSALTRALNAKNWLKVIAVADAFKAYYERPDAEPYPDDWSRWQRAREDALFQLQRQSASW